MMDRLSRFHSRVAPYTGAWIEIVNIPVRSSGTLVAPYTGAWIEIHGKNQQCLTFAVAPYTGAWIEILSGI